MNVLIFNVFLYIIWFFVAYKKEKRITIFSFLVLIYTGIAILGYYTVQNGIYYDTFGYYPLSRLSVEPYIYTFLGYVLLFLPFYKIKCNINKIDFIFCDKTRRFIRFWIIFYVCFTLLKLSEAIISISLGLANTYDVRHNEGVALFEYNIILSKFNGYGYFFLNATTPFVMLYSLIGMAKRYISTRLSLFLIGLCFLPSFFNALGMGSRGGMFMTFFCFLFFVFILYDKLPKYFVRSIIKFGIAFILVILIHSWAITIDRVGEESGFDSILRYFGESFPNLGWTVWDKAIYHPMGERYLPELFNQKIVSLSVSETHLYWEQMTGVPILNFKTYFGDLYVEFGVLGAFVFLMLTSVPIGLYFKKNGINIFNISYLYFYFQICVFAFSGFTKRGWGSVFELIIITLFVLFLKVLYKNQAR